MREPAMGSPRLAFLVLGMHRSGTSALTRVLSLCGAVLPRHLIPASEGNERGYFESQTIWRYHEQLLEEAGTSWHDPSHFPPAWFATPAAEDWVQRMAEAVRHEFGDSPVFVLKDPRLCRLLPFWRRVLDAVGAEPRCVVPLRHPREVAASLVRSEGLAESHALLLWLDYLLTAERDSRDLPRSFVLFPRLLEDWRAVLARLSDELGYSFPRTSREAQAEIEAFLTPDLRHQRAGAGEPSAPLHPWLETAWRWCLDAGATGAAPAAPLDALSAAWRDAESAFGPALASVEIARRAALADGHARSAQEGEQRAALELALAEERAGRAELRSRLEQRREELARLSETTRMLMRWVVERGRGDAPAPAPLRAALDAFAEAHPLEAPALAGAAALIADQRLDLEAFQRERAARAAELERLATRAGAAEDRLRDAEQRLAELARELAAVQGERAADRRELEEVRRRLREQAAVARAAGAEAERLAAECGRWMARAAEIETERSRSSWFGRRRNGRG
jgi:hypothetical protein